MSRLPHNSIALLITFQLFCSGGGQPVVLLLQSGSVSRSTEDIPSGQVTLVTLSHNLQTTNSHTISEP